MTNTQQESCGERITMKRSVQDYYTELCEQLSVRAKNVLKTNKLYECSAFIEKTSKPYFSFMNLRNAGKKTAKELDSLLKKLMSFQPEETDDESISITKDEQTSDEIRRRINTPIKEHLLSARSLNCLKKIGIITLGDLVSFDRDSILKIRGLGKSSFQEIENIVVSEGFHWGMDISKNYIEDDPEKQSADTTFYFLSKIDKDYVLSFKESNGYFPMIFILYKALCILTEFEREVLKLSWGIKTSSILPFYNTLQDISLWNNETITPMSLDEIANSFCLTRERIRQIIDKANKRLNDSNIINRLSEFEDWDNYDGVSSQPFIFFNELTFEKATIEKDFIVKYVKEHSTANWINEFIAGVPCYSANLYCFVIRLRGMVPYWVDVDKKELFQRYNSIESTTPFLFISGQLNGYNYSKAIKEVLRLQKVKKSENLVIPIISYFIENETYWNKKCKPTEIAREVVLQLLIRLVQTLCDVQVEDNTFLFKANRIDYGNLLYEILKTSGERLHRDILFEKLEDICHEKGLNSFDYTDSTQITQFLTRDSRIVPIGKSSYWGLKEWGELAGSIRDIAMGIMRKSKIPLQIEDLAKEVLKHRPDSALDNVTAIIRQSVYIGELSLFFDDYVGLPEKKYDDKFIIFPRSFQEWIETFKDFVITNKRFPYNGQLGYEGHLYRWHYKASQLIELSSEEILLFDALEKEIAFYPHNATEYKFLHNCNLYKGFVEGNNRMLKIEDDLALYNWFYSASRDYSTYSDNRNRYFVQLLQYISKVLY